MERTWAIRVEPERLLLRDLRSPENSTVVYTLVTEKAGRLVAESDKGLELTYEPATGAASLQRKGDDRYVIRGRCN